eukprot:1005753-Pyramimonas_sp.AAC.1
MPLPPLRLARAPMPQPGPVDAKAQRVADGPYVALVAAEGLQEAEAGLRVVPKWVERAFAARHGLLLGEGVPGACEHCPQGDLESPYRIARELPGR